LTLEGICSFDVPAGEAFRGLAWVVLAFVSRGTTVVKARHRDQRSAVTSSVI
jgi:hypothetical protein